ncbi:MAG: hypothetical protein SFT91_05240 [Rickettsiaceae bacterium]|nr:hypothetical protein [Rickettsiaceae bacterium]
MSKYIAQSFDEAAVYATWKGFMENNDYKSAKNMMDQSMNHQSALRTICSVHTALRTSKIPPQHADEVTKIRKLNYLQSDTIQEALKSLKSEICEIVDTHSYGDWVEVLQNNQITKEEQISQTKTIASNMMPGPLKKICTTYLEFISNKIDAYQAYEQTNSFKQALTHSAQIALEACQVKFNEAIARHDNEYYSGITSDEASSSDAKAIHAKYQNKKGKKAQNINKFNKILEELPTKASWMTESGEIYIEGIKDTKHMMGKHYISIDSKFKDLLPFTAISAYDHGMADASHGANGIKKLSNNGKDTGTIYEIKHLGLDDLRYFTSTILSNPDKDLLFVVDSEADHKGIGRAVKATHALIQADKADPHNLAVQSFVKSCVAESASMFDNIDHSQNYYQDAMLGISLDQADDY